MGLDVRLLLVANLPALAVGWGLARYTPLGTARRTAILGGSAFLLALVLLRGLPGVPGLQPVSVIYWGGLMLNLLLAVSGIMFSLPIGIALALGRRGRLPVVKLLCVAFIEIFRGGTAHNPSVHVPGIGATGLSRKLPPGFPVPRGRRHYLV